jgi:hypothetical protein
MLILYIYAYICVFILIQFLCILDFHRTCDLEEFQEKERNHFTVVGNSIEKVYMYICIYVCMYVCMYVCVYMYVCMCAYLYHQEFAFMVQFIYLFLLLLTTNLQVFEKTNEAVQALCDEVAVNAKTLEESDKHEDRGMTSRTKSMAQSRIEKVSPCFYDSYHLY